MKKRQTDLDEKKAKIALLEDLRQHLKKGKPMQRDLLNFSKTSEAPKTHEACQKKIT